MLFDEDFIEDIIEHSPPPLVSLAAVAERGPEDEDREETADGTEPADRGTDRGDASRSGDRGNRTGDRDAPGERSHPRRNDTSPPMPSAYGASS